MTEKIQKCEGHTTKQPCKKEKKKEEKEEKEGADPINRAKERAAGELAKLLEEEEED